MHFAVLNGKPRRGVGQGASIIRTPSLWFAPFPKGTGEPSSVQGARSLWLWRRRGGGSGWSLLSHRDLTHTRGFVDMICVKGAMEETPKDCVQGSAGQAWAGQTGMKGTQEASGFILPLGTRLSQPQQPDHVGTSPCLPGLPRCRASAEDAAICVSPPLGRLRDDPQASSPLSQCWCKVCFWKVLMC